MICTKGWWKQHCYMGRHSPCLLPSLKLYSVKQQEQPSFPSLLCRQPPEVFTTEEINDQDSCNWSPVDFTGFCSTGICIHSSHQVPPHSLSNPCWSPGHAPAGRPCLCGCISVKCHDAFPKLALTAVCILEDNPSSHVFAHCWPGTCHCPAVPHADLWQDLTAMEVHTNSRGPHSYLWAWILQSKGMEWLNGLKQKQKNSNDKK